MDDLIIAGITPDDIKLGATQVDKVMQGAAQVWPPAQEGIAYRWLFRRENEGNPGDGNPVSTVTATTGGNDFTQVTPANQPLARYDLLNIYDQDAVSMDAAPVSMQTGAIADIGEISIGFVYKPSGNGHAILTSSGGGDNITVHIIVGQIYIRQNGANVINTTDHVNDANWHYYIIDLTSGTPVIMQDGVALTVVGSTTGSFNTSFGLWDGDSDAIGARMAELIIFDSVLDATGKDFWNNYFVEEYFPVPIYRRWRFRSENMTFNLDRVNGVDDEFNKSPFAQGQYTESPLYIASDPAINNKDCIESIFGELTRMNAGTGNRSEFSIAFVYKAGSAADHKMFTSSAWTELVGVSGTKIDQRGYITDAAIVDTDWHYYIVDISLTATEIWQDGVQIASTGPSTFATMNGSGFWNDSGSANSRLAEYIQCDNLITTAQKGILNTYFATEYGL